MKTMEEQYNYQSNGGPCIPSVLGSSPGGSSQRSSDNVAELNFETYSAFAQGQIVAENNSTSSNMTFFHVSDDPRIQVTFNPYEGSGYLTIPQPEKPMLSDEEANELLEALEINTNSSENSGIPEFIPDGINGNSEILEFLPDGMIDLGIDLNIPSIMSQNGSIQRDCGVKVNSDKEDYEKSDTESEKADKESEKSDLEQLCKDTKKLNM
jgi:hypothetical protein